MASITRAQAAKLDAQAPNGWNFDLHYYLTHGEKTIRRIIPLEGDTKLIATIYYRENYETVRNAYGQSFNRPAGHMHLCLHTAVYRPTYGGMMSSEGLGHFHNIDHGQHTRRNYKEVCKIGAVLSDERILELHTAM